MQSGSSSSWGKFVGPHVNDPTDLGADFSKLPGGINGVAELATAKIGVYKSGPNQGKEHIFLSGSVLTPLGKVRNVVEEFIDGRVQVVQDIQETVEGKFTSQTMPLCATVNKKGVATSEEDNVQNALNTIKVIAGDECMAHIKSEQDFRDFVPSLPKHSIRFKFNTSSSKVDKDNPKQRVWENWFRLTGNVESNGQPAPGAGVPAASPSVDLDELAAQADEQDNPGKREAQDALEQAAKKVGFTQEQIDNTDKWADVAAMIRKGTGSPEPEPEADEAPKKGSHCYYRPLDPKSKKRGKKVECQITSVNKKSETVSLQDLDNKKKSYDDVPFSDLTED
jgi:hypothetical protein